MKILRFLLIILCILVLAHTSSFGFSTHPSAMNISRIFDKIQALMNESITIKTTFVNNEPIDLRGFYYVDHIPHGLTVNTISVKIDGNDVSNYMEKFGSVGEVYDATCPYRLILETPPAFNENNPIGSGSVLEITYSIKSIQVGTFHFNEFHWAGYYDSALEGKRAAFGHNEDSANVSVSWMQESTTLVALSINGPDYVNEDSTVSYIAAATFSTNETQLVTNSATWSVSPSLYANIGRPGELIALAVSNDQTVTIRAEYTFGDANAVDTMNVMILNVDEDNDGDGMPSRWELDYGLDPNKPGDALDDPDNDGYTNLEEYQGSTSPLDDTAHPIRPYVIKSYCFPYERQGIDEGSLRIPIDTSIVIRIKDDAGIDTNSIVMTIQGVDVSSNLRLKQVTEDNPTDYWVIYCPSAPFDFEQEITVTLEAKDNIGISMKTYIYSFRVESEMAHNAAIANTPSYTVDDYSDPYQYVCSADSGTGIEGAKIVYDPNEPIPPCFGPHGEIPELTLCNAVRFPLALRWPTVFVNPVTIFIPCPEIDDVSTLDVFCFNPAIGWVEAEYADGWMVPETRINHNETSPPTIELQVHYLSAAQAGASRSDSLSNSLSMDDDITKGSCFIYISTDVSSSN